VSTGAQQVSEIIGAAPLPSVVKTTAEDAALNAWSAAQSVIETPEVPRSKAPGPAPE